MAARLRVLSAGSNARGQLGHGNVDDSYVLKPALFATDGPSMAVRRDLAPQVVTIACGANHTLLLLEHPPTQGRDAMRELWGSGDGRKGQLGPSLQADDTSQPASSAIFQRVDQRILAAAGLDETEYTIHAIAASWESSFLVVRPRHVELGQSRDMIIAMGNNDHGDLGAGVDPSTLGYSSEPRRVALEPLLETYHARGVSGFHVDKLSAGPHHVIAVLRLFTGGGGEEDIVVGWGASRHGQLGIQGPPKPSANHKKSPPASPFTSFPQILPVPDKDPSGMPDPIVTFALGTHHSVFLHRSGRLTGLGSNRKGQLAGLNEIASVNDLKCTWNGTCVTIRDDRAHPNWRIQATGNGQPGYSASSSSTTGLSTVRFPFDAATRELVGVSCGSEHALVLFKQNDDDGKTSDKRSEVWGWGWNEHGNLGLGNTVDAHSPVVVWPASGDVDGGLQYVSAIWAGCATTWLVVDVSNKKSCKLN